MERDHHQAHNKQQETPPSLLSPHQNPNTDSPRNVAAAAANDRLKRDEWSEGAVSSLLEAYEAKWTLRNRAKLKGQDWEDVAKHVSARANCSKSAKTQTQCKNKIESMKKRYRSESAAAADASSWPLYPRLDLLLRGNGAASSNPPPAVVVELPSPPPPPPLEVGSGAQNSPNSNGGDRVGKEEEGEGTNNEMKAKAIDETDSSTPAIDLDLEKEKEKGKLKRKEKSTKRVREECWEIGESIRWLAEVVVRSEQSRMETMREIERMRAEAEAKRGELDLKRTEIIANTQLQIAKLFARGSIQ
ncbi:trihelix transcription factor ENAP2 [Salvia miltiorrhiza]|uniref:trihelix transcription factor ENAP2 n=1 Tax=Salvia miltiorrhiza TaxID=226208 RepID=UPI0025AD1840|nr:trihelix transcription factor ENAP2 [Salvia miltiorrhiza]